MELRAAFDQHVAQIEVARLHAEAAEAQVERLKVALSIASNYLRRHQGPDVDWVVAQIDAALSEPTPTGGIQPSGGG